MVGPGGGGRSGGPDKVYTWKVLCLDRKTGKEIWSKTAAEGKPKYGTHGSNTFATETPVSDGTNIYAYFAANGTVVAYDFTGKELWKKNIGAFPSMANWGTASSPAVDNGKVFIQCDNEEKSFVIALDAKTGEQAWKVNRSEKTSWSTPYIWKTKKRTELVLLGGNKAIGYNPENGKVIWELAIGGGGQCNTTPVGDEERLYIGSSMGGGGSRPGGFGGGRPGGSSGSSSGASNSGTLFAVNTGAEGEINTKPGESNKQLAWSAPKAMPSAASPVIYNGYLYTFDRQGGTVSCFNIKTGKAEYTKERIPNARAVWASPWAYDGKIFCLDESGTTHVLKAGATFEVLRTNSLARDTYWSTPSIAGGSLFIRSVDGLTCIK